MSRRSLEMRSTCSNKRKSRGRVGTRSSSEAEKVKKKLPSTTLTSALGADQSRRKSTCVAVDSRTTTLAPINARDDARALPQPRSMSPAPRAVLLGSSNLPYSPVSPSPSALAISQDGQYAVVARGELHFLVRSLPPEPMFVSICKAHADFSDSQTPTLGYSPALSAASTAALAGGASGTPLPTAGTKGGLDAAGGKGKEREQDADKWSWFKTGIVVEKKNIVRWSEWVDGASSFFKTCTFFTLIHFECCLPCRVRCRHAGHGRTLLARGRLVSLGTLSTRRVRCKRLLASTNGAGLALKARIARRCMVATITTNGEALLFAPKKNAVSGEWQEVSCASPPYYQDSH